jgi:hypothetical protein
LRRKNSPKLATGPQCDTSTVKWKSSASKSEIA